MEEALEKLTLTVVGGILTYFCVAGIQNIWSKKKKVC